MAGISSDGALVARALAGDASAAHELAGRHAARAWRAAYAITARHDLAEEAVQDGFERAFAALGSFDLGRPFGPWIARIVANRALSLAARAPTWVEFDETLHGIDDHDPEAGRDAVAALMALSPDRRAVVVLRVVAGLSPQETADALGLPVGTVHSRLNRALADLRRMLGSPRP